ncbi:MAG: cupin domain-containing protein [Ilumatobacteraceae bacterium]
MTRRRLVPAGIFVLVLGLAPVVVGCSSDRDDSDAPKVVRTPLLDRADATTLEQPLEYPDGHAEVSSATVRMAPGQETGWHRHDTPLYVQVIRGTVTVYYDGDVVKTYPAGSAFIEAIGTYHNGRNEGDEPVEILTVSIGAEGLENTVARP